MSFNFKKFAKKNISYLALTGSLFFSNQTYSQDTFLEKDNKKNHSINYTINKKLLEKYPETINEILENSGDKKEKAINYLPEKFLKNYSKELVLLSKMGKEETWSIFSYLNYLTSSKNSVSFEEAFDSMEKLNKLFGITYFNRYENSELMKENLKNLDSTYNASKPIALIIQNKNDGNVFGNPDWIQNLSKLKEIYKTFVYEAESDSIAFMDIKKTAEKFGKISLLILAGHGTEISLNLGNPKKDIHPKTKKEIIPYEEFYIDITDKNTFKKQEDYIKKDAKIILASCSTGKGGEDSENLANIISKALPGRTIYAPKNECKSPIFKFKEKECSQKKTLEKIIFYGNFLKTGHKEITYKIKSKK